MPSCDGAFRDTRTNLSISGVAKFCCGDQSQGLPAVIGGIWRPGPGSVVTGRQPPMSEAYERRRG